MAPQLLETRIPDGWSLTPRPLCQPRGDERPLLRDREGRVVARIDDLRPDIDVVN